MYWPYLTWVWYIRYTGACRDTPISASADTGSKVGNTIISNSVRCFSFSQAVRIPPPPVLLWHPAHCVHSWEHWPPPLWEWTRGVYMLWQSVYTHTPMIFVWLYTASHSKITLSLQSYMYLMDIPIHWLPDCKPLHLYSSFIYSVPCMAGCIWP